jgi:hypothetical protein
MSRYRVASSLLGLAQLGHAQWFFGNLYEAVVKVPDLLASRGRGTDPPLSPVGPGSPVRYYAAAVPATFPAVIAAAVAGWDNRSSRPWLVTAAACSVCGAAVTAYLVPAVNLKLFFSNQELTATEREDLLRTWYRASALRLAATGVAWLAAGRARSRLGAQVEIHRRDS